MPIKDLVEKLPTLPRPPAIDRSFATQDDIFQACVKLLKWKEEIKSVFGPEGIRLTTKYVVDSLHPQIFKSVPIATVNRIAKFLAKIRKAWDGIISRMEAAQNLASSEIIEMEEIIVWAEDALIACQTTSAELRQNFTKMREEKTILMYNGQDPNKIDPSLEE